METESKEIILNLLKVRQSYQAKLRDIQCSLEAASIDVEQNEEDGIELKLTTLQSDLLVNRTSFVLKERMLKYLQFSNIIRKVTHHVLHDKKGSIPKKESERSVLKKLEFLNELGQKMMTSIAEMEELNAQLEVKKKESLTLLIKARCLTSELKALEEREQERENQQKSETIIKLRKRLEKHLHINCIIRKVFLDLIHSTEIDWYEDETLRETVLFLGEKMQKQLRF